MEPVYPFFEMGRGISKLFTILQDDGDGMDQKLMHRYLSFGYSASEEDEDDVGRRKFATTVQWPQSPLIPRYSFHFLDVCRWCRGQSWHDEARGRRARFLTEKWCSSHWYAKRFDARAGEFRRDCDSHGEFVKPVISRRSHIRFQCLFCRWNSRWKRRRW